MFTFERTSGILVPRTMEREKFYERVKNSLHRVCRAYQTQDLFHYFFFTEGKKFLKLPRFFPIEDYVYCQVVDKNLSGEDIKIKENVVLRDSLQESMFNYMVTHDSGLIQAPPGSGKTVVCIKVVATRKKKTFVLVHRDSLADQWKGPGIESKQGFLDFTDLSYDDVARLRSHSFVEDLKRPVIISTVQTFLSLIKRQKTEFLTYLNNSNIGIFIADEVHTSVGAPLFSECSIHIPSRVVFGLSATPFRLDGNEDIIRFHVGEIFVPSGERKTVGAKVTVLMFDFGIPQRTRAWIYWGGLFSRSRYLTAIKKAQPFVEVCKSLLAKFSTENKRVIFVAERISLLENLFSQLETPNKSKFYGSAKKDQLDYQITFSTPGKIRDGVDAPSKDVLIMTSPISNIEQMCGRLEREYKGKERLVVVDMVDISVSRIRNTFFKRLSYYDKKGWDVSFVYLKEDGDKIVMQRKEALRFLKEL